ncbi:MAG TPA: TPM domain-containing protein [Burkholderiaceae bacterium]|nr:TPM domain-containing protein [Burkholderiaceae bacterium]HMY80032.1 TPM domain-containing protein [Thauera aminoaromatica]HMY99452.1 TPM domain-containing protein [Burkholderiaceae bacterium]HNG82447.1 TPM domain-containing protein [Burkholderiaceae bacterium]
MRIKQRDLRTWWRQLWLDRDDTRRALGGPAGIEALAGRIGESERRHGAQIRVCVEAALPWRYLWRGDAPRVRALAMFAKLRVWDTEANNGVLIYALLADRALEIVADRGVQARVSAETWRSALAAARQALDAQAGLQHGLIAAVDVLSPELERLYPSATGAGVNGKTGANELPDEPVLS